jgi:hypothetical protein
MNVLVNGSGKAEPATETSGGWVVAKAGHALIFGRALRRHSCRRDDPDGA